MGGGGGRASALELGLPIHSGKALALLALQKAHAEAVLGIVELLELVLQSRACEGSQIECMAMYSPRSRLPRKSSQSAIRECQNSF